LACILEREREQNAVAKPLPPTISMRSQFANKIQAKRSLPLDFLSQKNVSAEWWGVLDVLSPPKFLADQPQRICLAIYPCH
jgi:hypothetical protein